MRIFHLADLHIGKIVNGFSMINEQKHILEQVIDLVKVNKPKVFIIAGDVYDKRNPSNEAVVLFSDFLTKLTDLDVNILIVSGNHDSGEKLQFVSDILSKQGIYISGKYEGDIDVVVLNDDYGKVNFYLMPFVRPTDVRMYYPKVDSYHEAINQALSNCEIDYTKRNIFIGHQFFAGAALERSESEIISVGGIDNVGYNLLEDFDYAALGHLHKPQRLGADHIRYSGSPLKYSESEVSHNKSLVMIDVFEKGSIQIELLNLDPKTEMRQIKDYIDNILNQNYDLDNRNDFVHITLLDDKEIIDAISKLRNKYPNLMSLQFENMRTKSENDLDIREDISETNPIELFSHFFIKQNNRPMNKRQVKIVAKLMEGDQE